MTKKPDFDKDIAKEFGDVLLDPAYIIDNPPPLIPLTPKLDIALGGGVPEGSLFIMTGPEKVGKTTVALHFCKNAQRVLLADGSRRKIMYGNIEGRLKKRDLEGINGLDLDPDYLRIVGSTKGNILSGEKYLAIFDNMVHHIPNSVGVIDSFSALASEKELKEDLADAQVAVMQKFIAKFTRRFANVLPINRVTLVGITHIMANIGAMGNAKKKVEKSGNALKYAQDVKLYATHREPLKQGEYQIGQKINWIVENTATNTSPGQKVQCYMKYGRGIWEEMELIDLACDFGILKKSGAWIKFNDGSQYQGKPNAAAFLEQDRTAFDQLNAEVRVMAGLE